jgi:hypothetical protein
MAPSASVRVVNAVPGPTTTIELVVGRCSTIVQRFDEVSWTMKYSAARDGTTDAANAAAAITSFMRIGLLLLLDAEQPR